jgi:hypothetical protein
MRRSNTPEGTALLKLDEELAGLPIQKEDLSENDEGIYEDFLETYKQVCSELPDYEPHLIAQSVGEYLGLPTKVIKDFKRNEPANIIRISYTEAIFVDLPGEPSYIVDLDS